jgi:hypothetical protein
MPEHGRLALVSDAQGGDVFRGDRPTLQRISGGGQLRLPNLLRIVFHKARGRRYLGEFLLSGGDDLSFAREDDCAARRGSLVECEDGFAQGITPFSFVSAIHRNTAGEYVNHRFP